MTSPSHHPAALVLTGGGARGAYQAGVLSAIAEKSRDKDPHFPIISGVSAGAINAAQLASFEGTLKEACLDLRRAWQELTIESVFRTGPRTFSWSILRWMSTLIGAGHRSDLRGIVDTEPLRRFLSSRMDLGGIARNLKRGRLLALALSATNYGTGQTVTFIQSRRSVEPWQRHARQSIATEIGIRHVMASSALPLAFPAIRIGDEYFGDGSIRQSAPLSPAIHLGAARILAISVRYPRSKAEETERQIVGYPPPAQILGMLMNAVFLDALEVDAERLERVNRLLEAISPRAVMAEPLRKIALLVLRPSQDLGKLSAGYSRNLPPVLRLISRGLGAEESRAPDFLSYLLFEKAFVSRLIELGYEDTIKRWDEIDAFLEGRELFS